MLVDSKLRDLSRLALGACYDNIKTTEYIHLTQFAYHSMANVLGARTSHRFIVIVSERLPIVVGSSYPWIVAPGGPCTQLALLRLMHKEIAQPMLESCRLSTKVQTSVPLHQLPQVTGRICY